ncbi:putative POM121-like protein 1 isoform X1 [Fukomys damarensis]|uniref:putative POM121-like protein 1 isoform X1 n=1 Tax=Fukomys damarensis TaxID=885580 RepID=UPI00053F5A0F|nr:putative POM121-like protein 1 isoform X1 [Fukomys damarensis]
MEQQAQHRRGTGGPGTPPSAFEPAVGQRGPTAFVPRPGPLPRNLCGQRSRDEGDPGAQPSCASGLMRRNAVSCSYSSTGGLPGPGRGAATTRPRPLLGSSTNPEEKGVRDSRSAPEVSQETGNKKTADVTPGQAETRRDCVLTMEGAGPGIRKIPLLRRRRGDPLVLPSPPELSYQVTAEHTAREKEAALLRQQDADGHSPGPQLLGDIFSISCCWQGRHRERQDSCLARAFSWAGLTPEEEKVGAHEEWGRSRPAEAQGLSGSSGRSRVCLPSTSRMESSPLLLPCRATLMPLPRSPKVVRPLLLLRVAAPQLVTVPCPGAVQPKPPLCQH